MLDGGAGADPLNGGAGVDWARYYSAKAGVVADLADPINNTGEALGDTYSSVENIIGSAFSDTLRGNENANRLEGHAGNDLLEGGGDNDIMMGGAGDDFLVGGTGDDYILGGSGLDTAIYDSVTLDYVWFQNTDGSWSLSDLRLDGSQGSDLLRDIEFLQFGDAEVIALLASPASAGGSADLDPVGWWS
jgi:Ca2+-binding RTX toxin-like protein